MRTLKWNLHERHCVPSLFFSTSVKVCLHFEISFSPCCHQGMALVSVRNSWDTSPSLWFLHSLPQGLQWFLSHTPADRVPGSGSVLLGSVWAAAGFRYRRSEAVRAGHLPADWKLQGLCRAEECVTVQLHLQRGRVRLCSSTGGGGIVEDVLEVGPAGMSTCNWHFSANWESEETRRGAQLGMVGMAALEHSSPHSAIWRGRVRGEGRGGEERGGLRGYLREWLACKVNVPDTELWLAESKNQFCFGIAQPAASCRSWHACFFHCGDLRSLAGRHLSLQRSPRMSV